MADSPEALIEDALFAHLAAFTPALPTAYPNRAFSPPAGPYLRADFQPNRPPSVPIGFADGAGAQGIMQVTIVWPADGGTSPAGRVADAIMAHFARGTVLANEDVIVRVVQEPWRSGGLQSSAGLLLPVTIPWVVWPT